MKSTYYKPCNCSRPHLTKEHLFVKINLTRDEQSGVNRCFFSMANPYFNANGKDGGCLNHIERRGRPRKVISSERSIPTIKLKLSTSKHQQPSTGSTIKWTPKLLKSQTTDCRSNERRAIRKPLQAAINTSNGSYVTPLTPKSSTSSTSSTSSPVSPSSLIRNKYDVWHSIKNTFQEYRKLCGNSNTVGPKICQPFKDRDDHRLKEKEKEKEKEKVKRVTNLLDTIPFQQPPGSINGVTIFSMKNPFASKTKINIPIDELTRLYYATIDTIQDSHENLLDTSFDTINSLSSSTIILPLTPISPKSPMSTTSPLPMEDHLTSSSSVSSPSPLSSSSSSSSSSTTTTTIKSEDESLVNNEIKVKIEGGDEVTFKEMKDPNLPDDSISSGNLSPIIFDDIFITDFNEYEFDQMISNLPDIM